MADEYTPTTDEVREGLCISGGVLTTSREERDARFRRWLAAHDREVAERAWDEGHAASERDWAFAFDLTTPDEERTPWANPYREGGAS